MLQCYRITRFLTQMHVLYKSIGNGMKNKKLCNIVTFVTFILIIQL